MSLLNVISEQWLLQSFKIPAISVGLYFWLVEYLLQPIRSTADLSSDASYVWNFGARSYDVTGKPVVTSQNVCPTSSGPSFFAPAEASTKRKWHATDWWRSEMDHGKEKNERRSAKRLACFLLPAFLCAQIVIKRETSGQEAGKMWTVF